MIALDTNVLVRFIVEDDSEQSRRARSLIEEQFGLGVPCFVPDVVIVEFVWVLGFSYKISRSTIAGTLKELFAARQLCFEATDRLARGLRSYASGKGDFADYLIREQSKSAGCESVATFDSVLFGDDAFMAVPE